MNETELKRNQLEQLETFKALLRGRCIPKGPAFESVLVWLRDYPRSLKMSEREYIRNMVCESFKMTQEELDQAIINYKPNGQNVSNNISAIVLEQELMTLLPNEGLIHDYVEYTSHSEAPLAYHVFTVLCAVGAVLNRRVWFDMGYYLVYPTLGIIILGPSGIKKTSATNIGVSILQETGFVKIYSEKLTPEALIEAMKGDNATGLVYAPEMSVFLSKAQYNEGLVQLITRFMDCPNVWESGTIGRGKSVIHNIAISSAMCSTPDWFVNSTPADSFGGGFIARNLLIIQYASSRSEPIPNPGDRMLRQHIIERLSGIHTFEGQITFDQHGLAAYESWYRNEHEKEITNPDHELLATYYNRKPDHLKRIAIILHMCYHGTFSLCEECWQQSVALLNWTEQFLPEMLKQMFKTDVGQSNEQVLRIIHNNQPITHSNLVRKMAYKMNAAELKTIILSLKEARLIQECVDNVGHYYVLLREEK